MSTYYFAARYSRADELAGYRDELQAMIPGAIVTSRWLDHHDGALEQSYTPEYLNQHPDECWEHGSADIEDLRTAQTIVSFTGEGGKGGRHIEHGFALAMDMFEVPWEGGIRMVIIGARENIFHCAPGTEVYPDWAAFLGAEMVIHAVDEYLDEQCEVQ